MNATATQYVVALRSAAGTDTAFDECVVRLTRVHAELESDETVARFLQDPAVPVHRAWSALRAAYEGDADTLAFRFLRTVLANGHFRTLGAIIERARETAERLPGTVSVTIESAVTLSNAQRKAIDAALAKQLHRPISTTFVVHPEHIAGFRVIVDGARQWDGTVRGTLERLQRHITLRTA